MTTELKLEAIDATTLHSASTLEQLDRAARDCGLFMLHNHGIPAAHSDALLAQAERFFAEPPASKRTIRRTRDNPWGYFDAELTKNTPDWKEIFDFGLEDAANLQPQWPRQQPEFEPAVRAFYNDCEQLAFTLLDALTRTMGLPPGLLDYAFKPQHASFLRLNHYPVCPAPAAPEGLQTPEQGHLGVNHHTDSGVLTILLQDHQPGLEAFYQGRWHSVPALAGTLIVNLGDVMQVWSNDAYRAPVHRVRAATTATRTSAPFFFNPSYAASYAPLEGLTSAANPPRYRSISWAEFRRQRADGDFSDQGSEVQISDYARQHGHP